MEKVIRNNVAEGAVPAIDVTRQALRFNRNSLVDMFYFSKKKYCR